MVRDLVQVAYQMIENEAVEGVQEGARAAAVERVVDLLQPPPQRHEDNDISSLFGGLGFPMATRGTSAAQEEPESEGRADRDRKRAEQIERIRDRLRDQVRTGVIDERKVELEVEEGP